MSDLVISTEAMKARTKNYFFLVTKRLIFPFLPPNRWDLIVIFVL